MNSLSCSSELNSAETFRVSKKDVKSINNAFEKLTVLRMNYEKFRIESFYNWPAPYVSVPLLAKNGFYYSGKGDRVRCNFCKVEIHDWCSDDTPRNEHQKFSPNCPFNNNQSTDNIVIIAEKTNSQPTIRKETFDWKHEWNTIGPPKFSTFGVNPY